MNEELRNQYHECPTIYVSLASGMDEQAYRWVAVGAEEEGVPCLLVPAAASNGALDDYQQAVVLATAAARGSRLGVGIGIAGRQVVLQEAHMPAAQPVYCFPVDRDLLPVCRLAGTSAGRMVKRMPLRFQLEEIQPSQAAQPAAAHLAAAQLAAAQAAPSPSSVVKPAQDHDPAPDAFAPDLVNLIVRILTERGLS